MKIVNVAEFDELLKGETPVVCDFFADWCGPCKMLAPVLEEAGKKFEGKAVFVKVNVDDNMELAARYNVMSIPLVCIFKNGEISAKSLGYINSAEAEAFLGENL